METVALWDGSGSHVEFWWKTIIHRGEKTAESSGLTVVEKQLKTWTLWFVAQMESLSASDLCAPGAAVRAQGFSRPLSPRRLRQTTCFELKPGCESDRTLSLGEALLVSSLGLRAQLPRCRVQTTLTDLSYDPDSFKVKMCKNHVTCPLTSGPKQP